MNRREMLASVGLVSATALVGQAAEKPVAEKDPWVGGYLKFGRYRYRRGGQSKEALKISITKDEQGYQLDPVYATQHFTEIKPGVLSDGPGGLGKIYLGSAEFADGFKIPVLRAEFCYEHFILYREPALNPEPEVKNEAK